MQNIGILDYIDVDVYVENILESDLEYDVCYKFLFFLKFFFDGFLDLLIVCDNEIKRIKMMLQ